MKKVKIKLENSFNLHSPDGLGCCTLLQIFPIAERGTIGL